MGATTVRIIFVDIIRYALKKRVSIIYHHKPFIRFNIYRYFRKFLFIVYQFYFFKRISDPYLIKTRRIWVFSA